MKPEHHYPQGHGIRNKGMPLWQNQQTNEAEYDDKNVRIAKIGVYNCFL